MASLHILCAAALAIIAFWHVCRAQQCNTFFEFNGSAVNFTKCAALPTQQAVLAWSFYEENSTLSVAFAGRAPSSSGWVGWGVNPTSPGNMVGASALVAFSAANGSNLLPYKLTLDVQLLNVPLACGPIDLVIDFNTTAVEIQGTSMRFFVNLHLPPNQTTLNHIWNRGSNVVGFQPQEHGLTGDDLNGVQTIDMFTAQAIATGGSPQHSLKRTHGIINTIAWGILFPLGVMFARYLRLFSASIWFYIHAPLQTLGYVLGVSGWALGMKLRSETAAVHMAHQNIGIALFVLATVQVSALILRPNVDHKVRRFWNYYHHSLGYTIILLAIINIFEGLSILSPGGHWRSGYIASLVLMAMTALVLEVVTWIHYFKKQREEGLP